MSSNVQAVPERFKGTFQGFKLIMSGGAADLGHGSGFRGIWKGMALNWLSLYSYSRCCPHLCGLLHPRFIQVRTLWSLQALHRIRCWWREDGVWHCQVYCFHGRFSFRWVLCRSCLLSIWGLPFPLSYFLLSFQAVKVRVQTRPDFAVGLMDGLPKMVAEEGFGALYAGLVPLWSRQIPYTVIKFVAFEKIATAGYSFVSFARSPYYLSLPSHWTLWR